MSGRFVYQTSQYADWRGEAKKEEKERLTVLERRIEMKIETLNELLAEHKRIERRCSQRLRRKRKAAGSASVSRYK